MTTEDYEIAMGVLMIFSAFALIAFFLMMISRPFFCWYFKIDQRLRILKRTEAIISPQKVESNLRDLIEEVAKAIVKEANLPKSEEKQAGSK